MLMLILGHDVSYCHDGLRGLIYNLTMNEEGIDLQTPEVRHPHDLRLEDVETTPGSAVTDTDITISDNPEANSTKTRGKETFPWNRQLYLSIQKEIIKELCPDLEDRSQNLEFPSGTFVRFKGRRIKYGNS